MHQENATKGEEHHVTLGNSMWVVSFCDVYDGIETMAGIFPSEGEAQAWCALYPIREEFKSCYWGIEEVSLFAQGFVEAGGVDPYITRGATDV